MGFIEKLKQEAEAIELEQQAQGAKLSEAEVLRSQAVAFQTESGIGDLVSESVTLLKKVRFPDAHTIIGAVTKIQEDMELNSVWDGIVWNWKHLPGQIENGCSYNFVAIATRLSGEIVFYTQAQVLIPEDKWRNDNGILERTLEQAVNLPGFMQKRPRFRDPDPIVPPIHIDRSKYGDPGQKFN